MVVGDGDGDDEGDGDDAAHVDAHTYTTNLGDTVHNLRWLHRSWEEVQLMDKKLFKGLNEMINVIKLFSVSRL